MVKARIQGALWLLEQAKQEQSLPFVSSENNAYAKGFAEGQESLVKFMRRLCGKEDKS